MITLDLEASTREQCHGRLLGPGRAEESGKGDVLAHDPDLPGGDAVEMVEILAEESRKTTATSGTSPGNPR